ncbi:methylated-DNA--[protein]-cysteine S-methyltransferase [Dyadobacter sp. CY261]|uniref:bifunctional transcriptional activator/DNA repair enzyme AdaA n=1 Tax=Dyadobacter sp. CY261 TaxID=2907203 RepID=UPI001F42B2B8|nr:methylated-DNA--[protein]-cysteine S-methyltransferase [Dyadobacter sp. CY261]MCF0072746.1 methylated-DNA--[protein]-cysteine S-methyltransferase [Dyadobacter sp. CY261]
MNLSNERMYQAIIEKDTQFEGVFFTAVKTTGIFCRPTCTARKPKMENVEFVFSVKDAFQKGYRPCKVCRPLEFLNQAPDMIRSLLEELANDSALKIRDADLIARGLEPNSIRRWFLKNHQMTFHAYQRMHRINSAFKNIQEGQSITTAAFDSGFDSLSGFGDSFKSIFGFSPAKGKSQQVIDLKRIETPLGTMFACAVKAGVCLLEFTDRKMLETEFKILSKALNATIIQGKNDHFETLERELSEYFTGKRKQFTVPMVTPGSRFQNMVWEALRAVPYGETVSYQQQAATIERPDAIRAVANANGMNKISILVPCHRVIGTDGSLTGYGGGIWRKQWLLALEKANK